MPSDHTIQPLGPATAAPVTHPDVCPEATGPSARKNTRPSGRWGLIIDEGQIDHGPDWRGFDTDPETRERAAPVTPTTRHDKGLGTTISDKRDGTGRQHSGKKRRQLNRLRTRHSRAVSDRDRDATRSKASPTSNGWPMPSSFRST